MREAASVHEEIEMSPAGTPGRRFSLFLAGLALFASSYWLPSVTDHLGDNSSNALKGYACAAMAFVDLGDTFKASFFLGVCLFLADLTNALMVIWLGLRIARAGWAFRRGLSVLALVGAVPCALIFIFDNKMVPIWGYFVWVLGIILMTANDWRRLRTT